MLDFNELVRNIRGEVFDNNDLDLDRNDWGGVEVWFSEVTVTCSVEDYVRFHAERATQYFDEYGNLTLHGEDTLITTLRNQLHDVVLFGGEICADDMYMGEPGFVITLLLDRTSVNDLTLQQLWEQRLWPFIATARDILDPGSFGSPYAFSE